ncbi:hypothetical protein ACSSS7_002173 [Eimeria intestinalis]
MALHAPVFAPAPPSSAVVSVPPDSCGCVSCPGGNDAGSLRLLKSLQQRGALQRLRPPQGSSLRGLNTPQKEGDPHTSARIKGTGHPPCSTSLGSPRRQHPTVLGPRRAAGAPSRSPLHCPAQLASSVHVVLGAGSSSTGGPCASSILESGTPSLSRVSREVAEAALLVEGGEDLALAQQLALTKYLRLMGLTSSASFHSDFLYAGDRLRESCLSGAPVGPQGVAHLGPSEAGKRAAIVDIVMSYAADLKRCFGSAAGDVARVSIQLAVSILDRSRLVERVKRDPDSVRCCAAFCLVMALQHEAPNSIALEGKLKKLLLLEKLVPQTFGVSFGELQRQVLDSLDCRVSVPLPIDFASYLVYDAAAFGARPGTPGGPPTSATELVCYLLDCFSLTPEAAVTPASLAAAAAVELARRIAFAERGEPLHATNKSGPQAVPLLQEITGCSKQQLRATLKTIHSFLITKVTKYPGLRKLHEKGWAAVDWQLPQR